MADNLEIFGEEYTSAAGIKAYDTNGNLLTFVKPSGTVTVTTVGVSNCSGYASVNVDIPLASGVSF